jgi:hypothetical protein
VARLLNTRRSRFALPKERVRKSNQIRKRAGMHYEELRWAARLRDIASLRLPRYVRVDSVAQGMSVQVTGVSRT